MAADRILTVAELEAMTEEERRALYEARVRVLSPEEIETLSPEFRARIARRWPSVAYQ